MKYALSSKTIIMRERIGKISVKEGKKLKKFDSKMYIKKKMQLDVDELYQ